MKKQDPISTATNSLMTFNPIGLMTSNPIHWRADISSNAKCGLLTRTPIWIGVLTSNPIGIDLMLWSLFIGLFKEPHHSFADVGIPSFDLMMWRLLTEDSGDSTSTCELL